MYATLHETQASNYTFFVSISLNSKSQIYSGKILDSATKKPLKEANVFLTSNCNTCNPIYSSLDKRKDIIWHENKYYKILKKSVTDTSGKYTFKYTGFDKVFIIASYKMPKIDSLDGSYGLRQSIDSLSEISSSINFKTVITFLVTCPYDKTINRILCPKCNLKDRVLPIVFGLPIYDSEGNSKIKYEHYQAGCEKDLYCNPKKRCLRCNLNF